MEQHINFINIDTLSHVTLDVTDRHNNVMVTVIDSLGRTNVLVMHPALVFAMQQLTIDAVSKLDEDGSKEG